MKITGLMKAHQLEIQSLNQIFLLKQQYYLLSNSQYPRKDKYYTLLQEVKKTIHIQVQKNIYTQEKIVPYQTQ